MPDLALRALQASPSMDQGQGSSEVSRLPGHLFVPDAQPAQGLLRPWDPHNASATSEAKQLWWKPCRLGCALVQAQSLVLRRLVLLESVMSHSSLVVGMAGVVKTTQKQTGFFLSSHLLKAREPSSRAGFLVFLQAAFHPSCQNNFQLRSCSRSCCWFITGLAMCFPVCGFGLDRGCGQQK